MTKLKKKHNLFMLIYGLLLLFLSIAASDCSRSSRSKGNAEEIRLPAVTYLLTPDSFPFRFEVSDQAIFSARKNKEGEYFCDVKYPAFDAQLYCTWHALTPESFIRFAEESRRLVYSHTDVATAIDEKFYSNDRAGVFGFLYDIKGPVATPLQVALTDSTRYFFNASLYFNATPNTDSIAPYLEYIRKDVIRMMESFTPSNR